MTINDEKPAKKKIGRPTRASEGRAEQITVRLSPSALFMLELIARDRRGSLAQAVDYTVSACGGYEIDGERVADIAAKAAALNGETPGAFFALNPATGKAYSPVDARSIAGAYFRGTKIGKMLATPPRLLSARERYFLAVHHAEDSGYWEHPDLFVEVADAGFEKNLPPEEAAKLLGQLVREQYAGTAAASPPKKKKSRG